MIYLIKVKEEAIEFSKCGRSPKTHVTLTGDLTTFILNGALLLSNHVNFHDTTMFFHEISVIGLGPDSAQLGEFPHMCVLFRTENRKFSIFEF